MLTVEGTNDRLAIDLYADGGIRMSAPPMAIMDHRLVRSSLLFNWLSNAHHRGLPITVTGRADQPLVAPVLEQLKATGIPFEMIDAEPAPVRRVRVGLFRRPPSSLAIACRTGSQDVVADMLNRGADPEIGGRPWRWACRQGNVEAAEVYQRITGVRSRHAPPGTTNAVVVPLASARVALWIWLAFVVFGLVLVIATGGHPSVRDIAVTWVMLSVPVLVVWLITISPRAAPSTLAMEGWNLWYRREWPRRWEGPIDLRSVEAVDADVERGLYVNVVRFLLIGDGLPRRGRRVSSKARQRIGDRGYFGVYVPMAKPFSGFYVLNPIRQYLPEDIATTPETDQTLHELNAIDEVRMLDG